MKKLFFMEKKVAGFISLSRNRIRALKVSKYGVISGRYYPVSGLNTDTRKYGPEITPCLDTSQAVNT